MNNRDLILTLIDACANREEFGRTSLQKMAYFAAQQMGVNLGHNAYYYGPFSESVEQEVSSLALGGLVEERTTVLGHSSRGTVCRYGYSVTEDGQTRLKMIQDRYPVKTAQVHDLVGRVIDVAGSLDQNLLSQAAKTFFVAEATEETVGFEVLKEVATEHGWELQDSQRASVDRLLQALGSST